MNFKPGLTKINLNHSITKQGEESGGACFEHMKITFLTSYLVKYISLSLRPVNKSNPNLYESTLNRLSDLHCIQIDRHF